MSTATERCPVCGANLALVGRMHRCMPPANAPGRRSKFGWVRDVKPVDGTRAAATHGPATHGPATHKSTSAERQARYRAKDPATYRQRHRELMRRRRAAAKAAPTRSS